MGRRLSLTLSRLALDDRLERIRPVERFTPPVRGWMRAIREALGMSAAQLGQRLGMSQPGVVALERSEARGTIQLRTLQKVAEALDCKLVYALVPNKPLDEIVKERARRIVRARLREVEHTMRLENQAVADSELEKRIDVYLREIDPRLLWAEK